MGRQAWGYRHEGGLGDLPVHQRIRLSSPVSPPLPTFRYVSLFPQKRGSRGDTFGCRLF